MEHPLGDDIACAKYEIDPSTAKWLHNIAIHVRVFSYYRCFYKVAYSKKTIKKYRDYFINMSNGLHPHTLHIEDIYYHIAVITLPAYNPKHINLLCVRRFSFLYIPDPLMLISLSPCLLSSAVF